LISLASSFKEKPFPARPRVRTARRKIQTIRKVTTEKSPKMAESLWTVKRKKKSSSSRKKISN
jgi:hypothetical protein